MFSIKGAAFTQSLGQRPRIMEIRRTSAESAIHFRHRFESTRQLNRTFSAWLHGDLNSWGDAPGLFEMTPLALNRNTASPTKL
jgi:hypothetical protein